MPSFLIVDDSPTIRLTLSGSLRQVHEERSVKIVEAATEQDALEAFLNGSFDVVFLDMMLASSRNSMDLLRAILATRPDAKVILTTGLHREHPDVVEAISLGAFSHLRKPIRMAEVRSKLDEISGEAGRSRRIR